MTRRLRLLAALVVMALAAPAVAGPLPAPLAQMPEAPVRYRMAIDPESRTLVVTARFPAVPEPAIELVMASNHSDQKDLCDNVSGVRAVADDGTTIRVTRPRSNRWLVHADGRAFTLSYSVTSEKRDFMGDVAIDEVAHPTIFPDRSFLWGWSYLLKPSSGALKRQGVLASVSAPPGQPVKTTWHASEPLASVDALSRTLAVAGAYRFYEAEAEGKPVSFALAGSDWQFSDGAFIEGVLAVVKEQSRMMGFHPGERLLVVLEEGSEAASGGTAADGAIAIYPPPGRSLDAEVLALVAHEHFHLWNGRYTTDDPKLPEGELKWFSEGFTSYYAALTLLRAGLAPPEAFVATLNAEIDRYYANPVAMKATAAEMGRHYWGDDRYEKLAYTKGLLLAWLIDMKVREATKQARSLDDFMKAVMAFSARGESYQAAKLRSALEALTGQDWKAFFARHVEGAEELPFRAAGLPLDWRKVKGREQPRLPVDARTLAIVERLRGQGALPAAPR